MTPRQGEKRGIVVGVDGSPSSLDALRWAADQAARTGEPLEVLAAWDWPQSYGWAIPIPEGYDPGADAQRVADGAVEQARARHPEITVSGRTAQGHAAPILVAASEGADLLVVGCRGHGEFTGMLIGSVSEHCASQAHCPVLVYRGENGTD